MDTFHEYLYGSKFEVKTDNNPLPYIFDNAKLDAVGHRWVASLSNYDFKLTYRAGKANGDADPLSRIQPETKQMFHDAIKAVCSACVVSASNPCIDTVLLTQSESIDDSLVSDVDISAIDWHEEQMWTQIFGVKTLFQIGHKPTKRKTSLESEGVRKYLRDWDKFTLKDKIVYRYSNLYSEKISRLVLPPVYRDLVFRGQHDDAGHQGRDRTLFLIKSRFYWPGMDKDIEIKVKSCSNGILKKSLSVKHRQNW